MREVLKKMNMYINKNFFQFEYEFSKHNYQINDLMICLNDYLNHRTNRIIREIRYKEAIFRMKLKYPHHRRKSSTSNINKNISIYPEATIGTSENPFTPQELSFLSSTDSMSLFIDKFHLYIYRSMFS